MASHIALCADRVSTKTSSCEVEHLRPQSDGFGINICSPIARHGSRPGFRRNIKLARLLFSAAVSLKRKRADHFLSSHRHFPPRFSHRSRAFSSSDPSSPQSVFSSSGSFSSPRSSSSCCTSPPSSQGSFSEQPPVFSSYHRNQPRIQVSSLLSDTRAVSYHLEIVQQPQKTAEFRDAPLSRLPVTPPVIARLVIRDPSGNPVVP
ncbi:hypothetical protein VKT23_014835 [Stygiomarasmius scandens]|uniref:Uncharacterized protein n=1 Tax=Marasmiellus scandens TaxID=2682957 RepID=A0ABR1J3Z0_9AGAR